MRKRLVLLQALAILITVFQYGTEAEGQDGGRNSLSNVFYPYLIARIPLAGSGADDWLATTGQTNHARVCVHRRRIYWRYRRMPLWMVLTHILIGILCTGNRKVRFYCTVKVYHYQLILKSVLFYTLMEYGALVNEMLLMMSGDIESNPGPRTALTLKTVFSALHSVSHKWFNIGLQLDVAESHLKIIETDRHGTEEQMRTMLDYWMSNATDPLQSWKVLVNALKAPIVGENRLAKELEERYCRLEDQTSLADVQSSVNTSKAMHEEEELCMSYAGSTLGVELTPESLSTSEAVQSHSTISSLSKGSEKPPFGCGCGKCTFFTFIVIGCPKPTPSASSFPYLDPSELTPERQQVLRRRLQAESRRINIQFQCLVSTTLTSLKKQNVTVCDFLPHLMTFGTEEPVLKHSQAPVLDQRLNDLEKAGDLSKVFMGLKDYMSFFNYHLIEHIINVLGTKEDKAELKKYKTSFQQYAQRRVYECVSQFGPVSKVGHADIFVKVDSRYEKYTVSEIDDFCQELSEILDISSKGVLRLCRIEKGCFQLTFQVPSFVKEEIFPLSREQKRALAAKGVIKLTCGKYQFENQKDEPPLQVGDDKKSKDDDDESGVGPSISTTAKSTTVSEDHLEKELGELDYELRVQGLAETASTHEHWSGLDLHFAVLTGQLETVIKFLVEENNYNPMQSDDQGINAVHMAAINGNLHLFKYFITERNCNPACPGPLGLTPLHLASEQGHLDIVKYLVIEQGIDPVCEDDYGNTALHRACAGGCQPVVELLAAEIEKYNPTSQILTNIWHSTPLHSAIVNGHLNIVKFFISEKNYDPNILGHYGGTPLHYATKYSHLHIVKYLTDEQGCNPSCLNDLKRTPLHWAAMEGHMDIVKFLSLEKQLDPMCRDSDQNTPLHLSAGNGHNDVVKFLTLEMHCDPSRRNSHNHTALHLAAGNGHLDVVRFFTSDQNRDPNILGQQYRTPLHYATEFGHLHIVKYLTDEQGCNPSCSDDLKRTPFHCAAMQGHMDIVKFLTVEKHCDPMCRDSDQNTPLHLAATKGQMDIVKFLTLEMHCDPTSRNAHNDTALHLAAAKGHLDIVRFFTSEQNCDPNISGLDGGTPLHSAAEFSHLHIVKYLIDEQGCNPSYLDDLNRTPLHLGAMKGQMDIVKFLTVEKHCDPMCRDSELETPLHKAAQHGQIDVAKFLTLKMHCDPTSRTGHNATALHLAAGNGHLDIVRLFTSEQNCDPNIPGQYGGTLLHCAAEFGHLHIVKYLTDEKDYNLLCLDDLKQTPLHLAVINGHMDTVRFLTEEKQCDPYIPGQYGGTLLHYAAGFGHLHILKYLTDEQDCNPSCLDDLNDTPLHQAAMMGHMDIVKFLTVEKNCDPMLRNCGNDTPLHLAVRQGHLQVVTFFIEELKCPPDIIGQHNMTPLQIAAIMDHPEIAQYLCERIAIDMLKQIELWK